MTRMKDSESLPTNLNKAYSRIEMVVKKEMPTALFKTDGDDLKPSVQAVVLETTAACLVIMEAVFAFSLQEELTE